MFTHVFTNRNRDMSKEEADEIVNKFEESVKKNEKDKITALKRRGNDLTYSLDCQIKTTPYPSGAPLDFGVISSAMLKHYSVDEVFEDIRKSIENLDSCKPFNKPDMLKSRGLKLPKLYDYQMYILDIISEKVDNFVEYILAEASSRRIDFNDKELNNAIKLLTDKKLEAMKLKREILHAKVYKFPCKPLTTVPLKDSGLNLFESVTPL